ncbi:GNAT family N-acetyltransferase [Streptomyces actuosus]|uniref:GNAT family N-acetyltransferase n=1 Tax=Streptomyces actuosus TaxID=1885 RepID=UPI003F6876ED
MRIMGGDQVEQAVEGCLETLRPAADRDWDAVRAGRLEWSCRRTAEHIASDLIAYAGQLAGRVQNRYAPFEITFEGSEDGLEPAGTADVLDVIGTTGALLAAAVRTAPREARAFHPFPFGGADRSGFAAMGVTEVLLHTHDIAEGLGVAYEPPAQLAEDVLTLLFPHVRPGSAAWPTLLWATGRGDLPGRAPVTRWHWYLPPVVPAGRLTLHGVTPAAARDLALGGDGGFTWVEDGPFQGTRDAAGTVVKAYEAGVHRPEWGLFVLVRKEDGRAVGGMGFHGAPDDEQRAEVGYDLAESARGHGYASEALTALADRALARDGIRLLFAAIDDDNRPSQSVAERAGFTRATVEEERTAHGQHDLEPGLRLYVRRG